MSLTSTVLGGLDFETARWGIGRDLDEFRSAGVFGWFVLSVAFGLPFASIVVLLRRSMLALVPLAISVFVFGLWFLYYATDWFSNPGQGVWMPMFLLVVFGWLMVVMAIVRPWTREPFPELLNVRALFESATDRRRPTR